MGSCAASLLIVHHPAQYYRRLIQVLLRLLAPLQQLALLLRLCQPPARLQCQHLFPRQLLALLQQLAQLRL